MTNAEMLARCRTLLDEASAGFFTDAEIYSALTDGQKQVATVLLTLWQKQKNGGRRLPEVLRPLTVVLDSSELALDYEALPADFWYDLSLKYGATSGTKYIAYRQELGDKSSIEDNSYLADDFFYYIDNGNIYFEAQNGSDHYYTLTYLKKPTAIDASISPILQENSHSAIVFWATAQMLIKDQRIPESQVMMKSYTDELQVLI